MFPYPSRPPIANVGDFGGSNALDTPTSITPGWQQFQALAAAASMPGAAPGASAFAAIPTFGLSDQQLLIGLIAGTAFLVYVKHRGIV